MNNVLKKNIEYFWENKENENFSDKSIKKEIMQALDLLDNGSERIAEKFNGEWKINEWLKKAILLSFKIKDSSIFSSGISNSRRGQYSWYDKVDLKTSGWVEDEWTKKKFSICSWCSCEVFFPYFRKCCFNAVFCKFRCICRLRHND